MGYAFSRDIDTTVLSRGTPSISTPAMLFRLPSNVSAQADNQVIGNLIAINHGDQQIAFYFLKTDPAAFLGELAGQVYEDGAWIPMTPANLMTAECFAFTDASSTPTALSTLQRAHQLLQANALYYIASSNAVAGVTLDWVDLSEYKWIVIANVIGTSKPAVVAHVQMVEQVVPGALR